MSDSHRSVIALLLALALAGLVAGLVQQRAPYRAGPVVVGSVVGFEAVHSTSRDRNNRQRRTHVTRYPIVRYRIPDAWPRLAGQPAEHRFTVVDPTGGDLALGADVQMRLAVDNPRDAIVNSLLGLWLVPLFALFFGCALLLVPTLLVPSPRKASTGTPTRKASGAGGRIGAVVVVCGIASFVVYPALTALVLGPVFLLISVLALGGILLDVLRRLVRALLLRPADPVRDRRGILGLLTDLQQNVLLAVVMGGFLVASTVATCVGIERFLPQSAWSLGPVNHVRTALYLPQDYDQALCRVAAAGNQAGVDWLSTHGARPQAYCGQGLPRAQVRGSGPQGNAVARAPGATPAESGPAGGDQRP